MRQRFHMTIEKAAGYRWRVVDREDDRREKAYYTRSEAREACAKLNSSELTWDDLWLEEGK